MDAPLARVVVRPDLSCPNLRDVGTCLNSLAGAFAMPERRLLRGGTIDNAAVAEDVGTPGTIINLRPRDDAPETRFGVDYWHFPIANRVEKYATDRPDVRAWLREILLCLEADVRRFPVLIHCASGRDRTGIVIGALLVAIGIERELIIAEYMLSDGDVQRARIEGALDCLGDPARYFRRVDLGHLQRAFLLRA
jgi:protein-tyrosine phosphatase